MHRMIENFHLVREKWDTHKTNGAACEEDAISCGMLPIKIAENVHFYIKIEQIVRR